MLPSSAHHCNRHASLRRHYHLSLQNCCTPYIKRRGGQKCVHSFAHIPSMRVYIGYPLLELQWWPIQAVYHPWSLDAQAARQRTVLDKINIAFCLTLKPEQFPISAVADRKYEDQGFTFFVIFKVTIHMMGVKFSCPRQNRSTCGREWIWLVS